MFRICQLWVNKKTQKPNFGANFVWGVSEVRPKFGRFQSLFLCCSQSGTMYPPPLEQSGTPRWTSARCMSAACSFGLLRCFTRQQHVAVQYVHAIGGPHAQLQAKTRSSPQSLAEVCTEFWHYYSNSGPNFGAKFGMQHRTMCHYSAQCSLQSSPHCFLFKGVAAAAAPSLWRHFWRGASATPPWSQPRRATHPCVLPGPEWDTVQ